MLELSAHEARMLALEGVGLRTKFETVEQVINHLGLLQIDTVNVFERAHYLPLFSRLGKFDKQELTNLINQTKVVEYWAHEASFIPTDRLSLYKYRMDASRNGDRKSSWADWYRENHELVDFIKNEIAKNGPMTVSQIEHDQNKRRGNWWGWSPVKTALEYLFMVGDLTSAPRQGFSRTYALPEQVLPIKILEQLKTQDPHQAQLDLLMHGANTLAIATAKDIVDYHRQPLTQSKPKLQELLDQGKLIEVKVEGWKDLAYLTPTSKQKLENAKEDADRNPTTILSPFDPLVWNRDRAKRLFDFEYLIEIYTPQPKRIYGYYTLPILHNRKLIGRIDLKSNRQTSTLEVKTAWAEPWLSEAQLKSAGKALSKTLREAKSWQGLENITNEKVGTLSDYLEL
ncbi:MAG: winged helix-turn-helix domain-containing protein [Micrococcales bacterium]